MRPYPAISVAVSIGVMMWSHTPDTTRPIANPEKPLTKPPISAARRKGPKIGSFMEPPSRYEVTSAWMEDPSDGEAAVVPDQQNIHDLITHAIVVLQVDCMKNIEIPEYLYLELKCSYNWSPHVGDQQASPLDPTVQALRDTRFFERYAWTRANPTHKFIGSQSSLARRCANQARRDTPKEPIFPHL